MFKTPYRKAQVLGFEREKYFMNFFIKFNLWALLGSNQRPADYESAALTN